MAKKYLSLERLTEYDELIKAEIAEGDASVKSYVDAEVAKKANSSHTHDDRYYTETEIDTKISSVNSTISSHTGNSDIHVTTANKSNWNSAYSHSTSAHAPSNAERNVIVGIQKNGTDLTVDSTTRKINITVPTTAAEIGAATSGHNHDSAYDKKGAADSALASAKAYADTAASTVKNDLLNGAGTAYDTLKELGDLIVDNADAIDALETIASGKADAKHTHAIADVSGLQSALDGKAAASHGTHVSYSTTAPVMDGTASAGSAATVARSDHKHPTDTSRAAQTDLDALEEVVAGKADSGHTHSNYASTVTTTGSGNAITAISQSGNTITATKGATFLTAHPTITVSNDTTSTATPAFGGTFTAVDSVTRDGNGHVTKVNTKTITIPNTTATTSAAGLMTAAMVTKLNGIATGATKVTVDSALSSSSANPVQNKVVNSAISTLTSTVSANTSSISAHSTAIGNLQTAVGEFEEITSAEIQALFA